MRKLYAFILFSGLIFSAQAQTLSPTVISTSGGFTLTGGYSLSSTTGEMTMVETFSSGSSILTQGFQQPSDFNVAIPELPTENNITIFPNPNNGSCQLLLNSIGRADIIIRLYDALGKEVYSNHINHVSVMEQFSLLFSELPNGIYWLDVKAEGSKGAQFSGTQKINIVH